MTNDKDPGLEDELRPTLAGKASSPWVTSRTMADIVESLEKLRGKSNAEIDRDVEESLSRDGVVTPTAKKAQRQQALLDREVKRMGLRLARRLKRKHGLILASIECKLGVLEKK